MIFNNIYLNDASFSFFISYISNNTLMSFDSWFHSEFHRLHISIRYDVLLIVCLLRKLFKIVHLCILINSIFIVRCWSYCYFLKSCWMWYFDFLTTHAFIFCFWSIWKFVIVHLLNLIIFCFFQSISLKLKKSIICLSCIIL